MHKLLGVIPPQRSSCFYELIKVYFIVIRTINVIFVQDKFNTNTSTKFEQQGLEKQLIRKPCDSYLYRTIGFKKFLLNSILYFIVNASSGNSLFEDPTVDYIYGGVYMDGKRIVSITTSNPKKAYDIGRTLGNLGLPKP